MAFNTVKSVQVPLETFGSLVTLQIPTDLPPGVSPDNQDVAYVPGSVSSRPALQKVFATPFLTDIGSPPSKYIGTVVYAKSFVDPTGKITNFYLDSNGRMWTETPLTASGVYQYLTNVPPGSLCRSVTAFGREWFAFSDGLHGTCSPQAWDPELGLIDLWMDAPGEAPVVTSISLPAVNMVGSGSAPTLTITELAPDQKVQPGGYYTALNIYTSTSEASVPIGAQVFIAGTGTIWDGGPYTVIQNPGPGGAIVVSTISPGTSTIYTGSGTLTIGTTGTTAIRQGNVVTIQTASAHQLQVGYQALVAGLPATPIGGGIASVVISNENQPGIATVTTEDAHGLTPNSYVTLSGISAVGIGGSISLTRNGGIVTVTTTTSVTLVPGATINISGASDTSFNTSAAVYQVTGPNTFTFLQDDTANSTATGATVTLSWPVPDTATPYYYEVISCPTATTFQIAVEYGDGTWTTGSVSFAWDGTFYVTAIPNSTTLQYQQYGPNATSNTVGTVTPWGQAAPGLHQCVVLSYEPSTGQISAPSPPVQFVANGGQYISVNAIPAVGARRILAFTAAGGSQFFWIPVPAISNNQIISTSTVTPDGTSPSIVLDFSDNTLLSATGINTPGNSLFDTIGIEGALGFGYYGSRLITWGQRNRIDNLLNMGFQGGITAASYGGLGSAPNLPTGWTYGGAALNQPGAGTIFIYGTQQAYYIEGDPSFAKGGLLSQSMYEDAQGDPIATPGSRYTIRCLIANLGGPMPVDASLVFQISSASTGFTAIATIPGSAFPQPATSFAGYVQADFLEGGIAAQIPANVPSDLTLSLWIASPTTNFTCAILECQIIYSDDPWLDDQFLASYVNNPWGFDAVTGVFGPAEDTRKCMDMGIVRDTLYVLTQDPAGRLHEVTATGYSEPSGWTVEEVGANCGTLSAFCLTHSQADDDSAGGGEEWFAWGSSSGARMFGGDQPWKISEEIQPNWAAINAAANLTLWALNVPVARIIYFGLPTGSAAFPNLIYPVDYKNLDTAYQIAASPPVRTSFSGRLIATDNTRKWTKWNLACNGAALMYRADGQLSVVLFAGNGQALGAAAGFGNVYTLNPQKYTDDDYGQIYPYYVTYFFVNHDQEQMLGLGTEFKTVKYAKALAAGIGQITMTLLPNSLTNVWPIARTTPLPAVSDHDMPFTGYNCSGERIAAKFASSPLPGQTDNAFTLNKCVLALAQRARLPVRGAI